MQTSPANIYEFGDFQLDTAKGLLRRLDGATVSLTPRVFKTLLYMVEHGDAVLDKERIMEAVWPDSIVEENNLAQAISKLRQVFGETPGSDGYIVTVPGRGYRFVAEVKKRPTDSEGNETDRRRNGETAKISHPTPLAPQESEGVERFTGEPRSISGLAYKTKWLWTAGVAAIAIVGLAALFFDRYRSLPASVQVLSSPSRADAVLSVPPRIPEKSIAVLPFDNLSEEKQNAYFAVGVQDEIMSNLARIADLKVISRTSANLYRSSNARNSREIAQQLGVAHLLEGNVQRIGDRLRVNAQLIDARTDAHVWAQTYDRDVADLFAVQSEIAQAIALQLYAKISPAEKRAIERPPTSDLTAFDLYTRAKDFVIRTRTSISATEREDLLQAADLLNQAVARDPTFFQAYCQLAYVHDDLYRLRLDHTPARLALAEAAVEAAFRLRSDAGEAYLARAEHLYRGYLDYSGALRELEIARQTLPNDARLFELKGYIERRRPGGNQVEALRCLERAIDLDPRNFFVLQQTALSYFFLGRYGDEAAALDRMLTIRPDDLETKVTRAFVPLYWKADTRPLHQLMDEIRAKGHEAIQSVAAGWLECALAERDAVAAADALVAMGENTLGNTIPRYSPRFVRGLIARMTKDDAKARDAFTAARVEQEKLLRADPDDAGALCVLGLIDAALGRKEEALREGWRAVELLPVEKDSTNGTRVVGLLAIIAAWAGENDLACEQLAVVVQRRNEISYGELKLLPFWDPLRGDPCFERIVASLAPKGN
jgi:TolB-like protein/DNA-binding winged helix-turn-helix (wHTH) protein/Flp pilus assembly protein TadD